MGTAAAEAAAVFSSDCLEAHLFEVRVALGDALKRLLRMIVLDDIVLDACLVCLDEDSLPVDDAAADLGQVDGITVVLRASGRDLGRVLRSLTWTSGNRPG